MAFPYIFESNFEAGTNAEWDSETDNDGVLDFPHFTKLAGLTGVGAAAPYRGAYCMRVLLNGGTNPANLVEGDLDIAATGTAWASWQLFIGRDFTATADDVINILKLIDTATTEGVVSIRITAATGIIELGVGETNGTVFGSTLERGRWHHIEAKFVNDQGANDGTVTVYLDGVQAATIGSLDQGAITTGSFGAMDHLATTTGTLLFDAFKFDDLQVYPPKQRFPKTVELTKTQHVFVGPGWIDSAFIRNGMGTVILHDSDNADSLNAESVVILDSDTPGMEDGAYFERGCYAVLTSSAQAEVVIHTGGDFHLGKFGPKAHWSSGAIRHYGSVRKAPRYNQ